MSGSDEIHSHESSLSHPHKHDEPSIIAELNARFTELRTLLITIGSILALLMTGLHQSGFIDDYAWLIENDDEDITPLGCVEVWDLEVNHYVIEYDVLFNIGLHDENYCNLAYTIDYNITMGEESHIGESQPFRNQYFFANRFYDLEEGIYHASIEIKSQNGNINHFENIVIDFEFDEGEQAQAIYGCTNTTALNYNETNTNDDGTCEYEQEEEEVTENCNASFYSVKSYWYNNNTTNNTNKLLSDFDVDFTCMANVTVTVKVDVYYYNNTTGDIALLYNHSSVYDTYYYDWDDHYIDFLNVTKQDMVNVQFRVYHENELNDEKWYWLEA